MADKRIIAVDLNALRAFHNPSICGCYDCQIVRARVIGSGSRGPGADRWRGRDRNV